MFVQQLCQPGFTFQRVSKPRAAALADGGEALPLPVALRAWTMVLLTGGLWGGLFLAARTIF